MKPRRTQKRKRKGGKASIHRANLDVPTDAFQGVSKSVWFTGDKKIAMVNATMEQMNNPNGIITYKDQIQEFLFSFKLYTKYPTLFPQVYHLDLHSNNPSLREGIGKLKTIVKNNKPTKKFKFIWAKEVCPIPEDELTTVYLKKAILLLVNLMEQELCYLDVKFNNIGKRGSTYVIIDTGREDIYYIPKDFQIDYLKAEILCCCMTLNKYLQVKYPNYTSKEDKINTELGITKENIKQTLQFIMNYPESKSPYPFFQAIKTFISTFTKTNIDTEALANKLDVFIEKIRITYTYCVLLNPRLKKTHVAGGGYAMCNKAKAWKRISDYNKGNESFSGLSLPIALRVSGDGTASGYVTSQDIKNLLSS